MLCVLNKFSPFSRSVSRQAEGAGGDQELHYPISGQRSLPDQHAGQQCPADARHPGVTAPPHGVLHQPHLTGRRLKHKHQTHELLGTHAKKK